MTSLNVSLPKALKEYIEGRVSCGAYSTPSEYVRELIRTDQKRQTREKVEAALFEGLNSGPATEIGRDYWTRKRKELRRKSERRAS